MISWDDVRRALDGGSPAMPENVNPAKIPAAIGACVITSGSTGSGKVVLLSRAALLASAQATEQLFGQATWTCVLPTNYVAGLMTMVRTYVAGTSPIFSSADLSDLTPAADRNAISIVSTQLVRALDQPAISEMLARYDVVLVGGSAIRTDLIDRARSVGINIVLSYGMSETCGGCVYDGMALPQVQMQLNAEPGIMPGQGRIYLKGPMLFDGYLGDAAATTATLSDGWFRTSDRGRLVNDRLEICGRTDSIIISGGVNVDLSVVQRLVDQEPIVGQVIAVPDSQWGDKIVLIAEPGRDLSQWRTALAQHLDRCALPKQLVIVDKLPESERGKPNRLELLRLIESA